MWTTAHKLTSSTPSTFTAYVDCLTATHSVHAGNKYYVNTEYKIFLRRVAFNMSGLLRDIVCIKVCDWSVIGYVIVVGCCGAWFWLVEPWPVPTRSTAVYITTSVHKQVSSQHWSTWKLRTCLRLPSATQTPSGRLLAVGFYTSQHKLVYYTANVCHATMLCDATMLCAQIRCNITTLQHDIIATLQH